MSFWRTSMAIFRRDLRVEIRGRETLGSLLLFALLTVVVFVFSFDPARHAREDVVPGTLWTSLYFAGMLAFARGAERDARGGMEWALRLSPADRGAIFVGKCLSHLLLMLAGLAMILPLCILFFDLDGRHLGGDFFLLLFLGTLGFVAVGVLFAGIGSKSRLREIMLPLLMLPVLAPVVRAAVEGTAIALSPGSSQGIGAWIKLLAGFDALFLIAGFLLYASVLEE